MKKKPTLAMILENEKQAATYQHEISQNPHNPTKGMYFTGKIKSLTLVQKHFEETEQIGIWCNGCREFTYNNLLSDCYRCGFSRPNNKEFGVLGERKE